MPGQSLKRCNNDPSFADNKKVTCVVRRHVCDAFVFLFVCVQVCVGIFDAFIHLSLTLSAHNVMQGKHMSKSDVTHRWTPK